MTITIEEAKKMVGTEFVFVSQDGDTLKCFVKWIDPETGKMTCHSLSDTTREGWKPEKGSKIYNEDGTWCVLTRSCYDTSLVTLGQIKETGAYVQGSDAFSSCSNNFMCNFS